MREVFKQIKIITTLVCLALILAGVTFAQKTQSSVNKRKFLTPQEIVFEFEQMLKQTPDPCDKLWLETYIATASFTAGNTEKAKTYAQTLVTQSETIRNNCVVWGRAIHYGNLVLGHIALASGDTAEAKIRLVEAGKMPGDPALNSFGPNMSLAKEFVERNEKGIVIEDLNLCAKFWKDEFGELRDWKALLKRGGYPDFGVKGDSLVDYKIDAELLQDIQLWLKKGILTKPLLPKGRKS